MAEPEARPVAPNITAYSSDLSQLLSRECDRCVSASPVHHSIVLKAPSRSNHGKSAYTAFFYCPITFSVSPSAYFPNFPGCEFMGDLYWYPDKASARHAACARHLDFLQPHLTRCAHENNGQITPLSSDEASRLVDFLSITAFNNQRGCPILTFPQTFLFRTETVEFAPMREKLKEPSLALNCHRLYKVVEHNRSNNGTLLSPTSFNALRVDVQGSLRNVERGVLLASRANLVDVRTEGREHLLLSPPPNTPARSLDRALFDAHAGVSSLVEPQLVPIINPSVTEELESHFRRILSNPPSYPPYSKFAPSPDVISLLDQANLNVELTEDAILEKCTILRSSPPLPLDAADEPRYVYIHSSDGLDRVNNRINDGVQVMAWDAEYHNPNETNLKQVVVFSFMMDNDKWVWLVHLTDSNMWKRFFQIIRPVFSNSEVLKVAFGVKSLDVELLFRDFAVVTHCGIDLQCYFPGVQPLNLVDASAELLSLDNDRRNQYRIQKDEEQNGDWSSSRLLTDQQCYYAGRDAMLVMMMLHHICNLRERQFRPGFFSDSKTNHIPKLDIFGVPNHLPIWNRFYGGVMINRNLGRGFGMEWDNQCDTILIRIMEFRHRVAALYRCIDNNVLDDGVILAIAYECRGDPRNLTSVLQLIENCQSQLLGSVQHFLN